MSEDKKEENPSKESDFSKLTYIQKIGKKLTLWSQKDCSTYLGDFVILAGIDPDLLDDLAFEDKEFDLILKHAKLRIAKRLRDKLGKKGYSSTLFAREIGMYDLLLQKYETEQMKKEQQIKKDMGDSTNFTSLIEKLQRMEDESEETPL